MNRFVALPLLISVSGVLLMSQASAITPSQLHVRVNAICNSHASMSRIANPDVVFEMCLNGAGESMRGQNSTCKRKIKQFSEQSDSLHGMGRAEYIEIAQAYRAGCNAGMVSPEN